MDCQTPASALHAPLDPNRQGRPHPSAPLVPPPTPSSVGLLFPGGGSPGHIDPACHTLLEPQMSSCGWSSGILVVSTALWASLRSSSVFLSPTKTRPCYLSTRFGKSLLVMKLQMDSMKTIQLEFIWEPLGFLTTKWKPLPAYCLHRNARGPLSPGTGSAGYPEPPAGCLPGPLTPPHCRLSKSMRQW